MRHYKLTLTEAQLETMKGIVIGTRRAALKTNSKDVVAELDQIQLAINHAELDVNTVPRYYGET